MPWTPALPLATLAAGKGRPCGAEHFRPDRQRRTHRRQRSIVWRRVLRSRTERRGEVVATVQLHHVRQRSERVSEATARFTLDVMPRKQMPIDAERCAEQTTPTRGGGPRIAALGPVDGRTRLRHTTRTSSTSPCPSILKRATILAYQGARLHAASASWIPHGSRRSCGRCASGSLRSSGTTETCTTP